ncbi:hypothetical protein [Coralliovum pocilloporae]|uniref:hypothetical protein n=1 Tax=Coralliovum pocilloporae TaxID=3066369 RepID=UPI003306D1A5
MANKADTPWSRIKALYEGQRMSVAALSRQFGVSQSAIHRRKKQEHWTWQQPSEGKEQGVLAESGAELPGRTALVARLRRVFDKQVSEVEARLGRLGQTSLDEKDARTLSTLVRTAEKLMDLEEQDSGDMDKDEEVSLETLREDLARRLGCFVR